MEPISPEDFNAYRSRMNSMISAEGNLVVNRLFNLDTQTYQEGALDHRTKEMLGLVSSLVLRCDDCVRYHLGQCHEAGINRKEIMEVFSVGTLVGGTIVIPHLRRALEYWDMLERSSGNNS